MSLATTRVVLAARIKTHPSVFLPIARLREDGKRTVVRRDSDLVIEGYWRCANHFAVNAFIVAQPGPVHVAHHFHAPAQLMLAVRWNVPALLLIREPVAAVSSATVFLEHDDPRPLLQFYNIFHEALVPYREQLVVSDFPRTTNDFGSVIAEINERYARSYALYRGTPEERERVEALIREEHSGNMQGNIATLPLPSEEKERRKTRILERLNSRECADLLDQARHYYGTFAKYSMTA
jgi:hypothetical protein